METIEELTGHLLRVTKDLDQFKRYLVAVAGSPGSGKTTIATQVIRKINEYSQATSDIDMAGLIPMDGFHLTRAQLDAMPDPIEAHARRGAPFTFDPHKLKKLVERLREPIGSTAITAPSFDHAVKDPLEDDIHVLSTQRIIILEGNYLHLKDEPWCGIAAMMDELWYVDVDRDLARERLIARHLKAGLADTPEAAGARADSNDLPNGDYIKANSVKPTRTIKSAQDSRLKEQ
ncbi:hypothetical protein YB2330_002831 [Saitoella coloradoensis]